MVWAVVRPVTGAGSEVAEEAGMAGWEMAPRRSARDLFGAELRSWRRRNGLSHASLARSVHCSASQIGRIEQSDRWPSKDLAVACDTALVTGGALARLWPAVEEQRRQEAADQPARHTADRSAGDRDRPDQHPAGDPTSDVGVVGVPAGDAPAWTGAWRLSTRASRRRWGSPTVEKAARGPTRTMHTAPRTRPGYTLA